MEPMEEPIDKGKWNNIGVDYQLEIITYAAACLSENKKRNKTVENFQIYTNQEVSGFDDIILKVKYKSEKKPFVYLGQIREHSKDKVNFKRGGDDSLQKYMEQISEIYKTRQPKTFLDSLLQDVHNENIEFWYISNSFLWNCSDSLTYPLKYPIKLKDGTRCYLERVKEYQSFFPLQDGATCYKWITKGRQPLPLDLRKFYVFLKQPKHNKVADSIAKLYPNNMSAKIAEDMVNFVKRYLKLRKSAMLTKHVFETHLLYLRLHSSNFTVAPKEAIPINRDHAENWSKLVMRFDVTLASSEMQGYIFGCLHQNIIKLYDLQFKWEEVTSFSKEIVNRISSKLDMLIEQDNRIKHAIRTPDTIYDLLIEMWKSDYLPLVLNADTDVTLLDKYKHLGKKFVILQSKEELYQELSRFQLKIFANVADITKSDLAKEFLESLFISLQGREPIGLFSILNDDTDLMKEVKCDQLLFIMRDRKNLVSSDEDENARIKHEDGDDFYVKKDKVIPIIGKCLTNNNEKYIERWLRKPTIQETICDSKRLLICLISGDLNSIPWTMKKYYKFLNGRIDDIVASIEHQIKQKQSAFIGIKDEKVDEVWSRLSLRHPLLNIIVENGKMVLLKYRNCPNISSYISYKGPQFNEESFFEETSIGVTVLTGEPGSGKTTLLQSLFNACPKHCFALFCDLKNYVQDLRESNSDMFENPISFILRNEEKQLTLSNKQYSKYNFDFLKEFLEKTKEELILFLDSFDEVLPGCKKQILKFIRELSNLNGRVIIASRLVTAYVLGKSFEVKLLKIDTLSRRDIQTYLNNEELSETVFEQYPPEFRKNPLYLNFMIALYRDDALPSVVTPSSLFSAIIEKHIKHFYHDKKFTAKVYEYYRKQLLEIHQKLALIAIFGDFVVNELDLDFEGLREKCTYSGNLKSGLIVRFSDRRPIFFHRTIVEFLVAEWLIENINKDIGKRMYTKLFKGYNRHVRYLLDDILCRNLALHEAVIQGDLTLVKHLCSEDGDYLKEVDKLNRTALEVAASYCSYLELDVQNGQILEEIVHHMTIKGCDLSKRNLITERHWTDYLDCDKILEFGEQLQTAHTVEMYCCYKNQIERGFDWGIETGMLDMSLAMLKKDLDLLQKHFDDILYQVIKEMRVDLLSELIEWQNSNNMEFDILCRACKNLLPVTEVSACTSLKIEGGFTAVHIACIYGSVDVVEELVRLGVEVNAVDDFVLQPLSYAIGNGSIEIITILVKLFKKEEYLPSNPFAERIFPMYVHNSLRKSDINIAKILLDNGFDINEKDKRDRTALHFAVQGRYIWRNCKCFPVTDVYSDRSFRDGTDINIDEINFLLKYRADCNIQDNDGITPLHIAVENGRLDVTEMLWQHGANINLHYRDGKDTVLHNAVFNKSNEFVKSLLQYGADVNLPNKYGRTALFNVVFSDYCDIVETLVGAGANVNHQDERGETALHVAAENLYLYVSALVMAVNELKKRNDIVKLLLQYGADVNILNEKGETALFRLFHCSEIHCDTVETLVDAGTNVNHQNNIGDTVLIIATQNNHFEPIRTLLEKGAEINHQNEYGNTALHDAVQNYYNQICKKIHKIGYSFKHRSADGIVNILLDGLRKNDKRLSTLWPDLEIMEMLLTGGADHRTEIADTRLRTAADILKLLVDSGADVNVVNKEDLTALGISNKYKTSLRNYCKESNIYNKYPDLFKEANE